MARRLSAAAGRGPSALTIPVSEASRLGAGGYVALISPFVPRHRIDAALLDAVRAEVARFTQFDFRLDRVGRFPQGVLYLAPEPAKPFVDLIEALARRWPEHPPYGGEYADIVPHVTVWFTGLMSLVTGRGGEEPRVSPTASSGSCRSKRGRRRSSYTSCSPRAGGSWSSPSP